MTPETPGASSPTDPTHVFDTPEDSQNQPPTLESQSAAISDILDRLDAGDQLYRELRDQVQKLARLVEPLPALEPEPRRVIGMRDREGREWPDIWDAWDIEVAHGDRSDPAAWADYLPHSAPFSPIYEDAPEPEEAEGLEVSQADARILATAEQMVRSALDAQDRLGAFDLDPVAQRSLPAPLRTIHALLGIVRSTHSDATALLAEKDAEIAELREAFIKVTGAWHAADDARIAALKARPRKVTGEDVARAVSSVLGRTSLPAVAWEAIAGQLNAVDGHPERGPAAEGVGGA